MRRLHLYIFILCLALIPLQGIRAQQADLDKYHRSSLYSLMLKHPEKEFGPEIVEAFKSIPIPDKYNDHTLKLTVFPSPVLQKLSKDEMEGAFKDAITKLMNRNKIARRMVEKWFDRDSKTGAMDMKLVMERGLYDASILDVRQAQKSARGTAILADAGEELLNHTYVLVNDIRYADKEVEKYFTEFTPLWANIEYEIASRRTRYLNDKLFED